MVDKIWAERPALPKATTWLLEDQFSGETMDSKIARIREEMKKKGADAHLVTALYDIAYILNIRGNDIENVPVFLSFLIITDDSVILFTDTTNWPEEVMSYLNDKAVKLYPYDMIYHYLQSADMSDRRVLLDQSEAVNRDEYFVSPFVVPGLFEQCHYLMEIQNCLINFYEYPDEMEDLIKSLAEWEIKYAEEICKYMKPDALFHHDDWGSQISTFLKPEMFEEFYLQAYKDVYGTYKENGVQIIVHHSDSYAATLVPFMIDMGIDVWQGVMKSNNIPELIKKYGGQITFMGGIDSAEVDFEGWTEDIVKQKVREACTEQGGKLYFIPNASQGLPVSTFPGVYECIDKYLDEMSKEMF